MLSAIPGRGGPVRVQGSNMGYIKPLTYLVASVFEHVLGKTQRLGHCAGDLATRYRLLATLPALSLYLLARLRVGFKVVPPHLFHTAM
jgi:hypothetical protein